MFQNVLQSFDILFLCANLKLLAGLHNKFGLCSSLGRRPQGQADPRGGPVSGRCVLYECVGVSE